MSDGSDLTAPSLDDLLERARRAHQTIRSEPGVALLRAFDAGEALTAAKELVETGQWNARLRKIGIPPSTARLYMQLARERERIEAAGCTSIREARLLLSDAKPREPRAKSSSKSRDSDTKDRYEEGYLAGYRAGRADAAADFAHATTNRNRPASDTEALTDRDLKWLIRLAHPDVHQDPSVTLKATRVTAWLTSELDKARR